MSVSLLLFVAMMVAQCGAQRTALPVDPRNNLCKNVDTECPENLVVVGVGIPNGQPVRLRCCPFLESSTSLVPCTRRQFNGGQGLFSDRTHGDVAQRQLFVTNMENPGLTAHAYVCPSGKVITHSLDPNACQWVSAIGQINTATLCPSEHVVVGRRCANAGCSSNEIYCCPAFTEETPCEVGSQFGSCGGTTTAGFTRESCTGCSSFSGSTATCSLLTDATCEDPCFYAGSFCRSPGQTTTTTTTPSATTTNITITSSSK